MKVYRRYVLVLAAILWTVMGVTLLSPAESNAQQKGGGQVVITGNDLEIDSKNKIATYRGDVKVVQGSTTMFSDSLVMSLDDSGTQLKQAVAKGNVRLVNETITATGGEGMFYNQEQKIVLTEKAKVWQGNNAISAARIVAYLEQEVLEGYSSPDERALMTIYSSGEMMMPFGKQGESAESSAPKSENGSESEAASEDSAENGTSKGEPENTSPITIEADNLRLDNSTQQGRFSGSVKAVNNATQLYADDMLVYITEPAEGENDIDKIEIFGNVKIINETQTVTGDKGFFWNQDQRARIEGEAGKKARIEDTSQNLVLEAPVVEIDLATNKVTALQKGGRKEEGDKAEEEQAAEEKSEGGSERIRMTLGTDKTESIFGDEPEERFMVTEKTLETLKEADLPDEVIEDLELLLEREFSGQDAFIEELKKRIGADNADKYKKLLLKYSTVEETRKKQDLPSVTIQPDNLSKPQD